MTAAEGAWLPIRTVASLTGVNSATLRAWERRYGLLRPSRTAKGHRLYSHQHVELIHRVLALVDQGVPIGQVRPALAGEDAAAQRGGRLGSGPWRDWRERMATAIARFDEYALDEVYDEALALHPIERATRLLLMPLLADLGRRWQTMPGGIAEEHFFAVYLRNKLGARFHHRRRLDAGPRVLAACAPGEHHEIGLLLFALAAHDAGLRVVLLGADVPLAEVAVAVQRTASLAAVVSSSMEPAPEMLARAMPKFVRAAGVPVYVGGLIAESHRDAIVAAGAVALGTDIDAGVRMIKGALTAKRSRK
jgi:MerR family transcriptional regulator, light-induced transcriptional regulator